MNERRLRTLMIVGALAAAGMTACLTACPSPPAQTLGAMASAAPTSPNNPTRSSDPSPVPSASGIPPSSAAIVVIMIGLKRSRLAS